MKSNYSTSTAISIFHFFFSLYFFFFSPGCRYFIKRWYERNGNLLSITKIECSVHPHFCFGGGGWGGRWTFNQIFKKGGLDKTSTFRGGLLGKRVVVFFRGGCNFYIKNKLKSEIFNDKKKFIKKIFLSVITKNSNWEILTTNLVIFKR